MTYALPHPLLVNGLPVQIDGEGEHVIVFLHGWPDTAVLWDAQVRALSARFRCVRFTWPGFDVHRPRQGHSLDHLLDHLLQVIAAVSPDRPVTLLMHDWGAFFGFQFAARFPEAVARLIAVDIGDAGSPAHQRELPTRAKLGVVLYQGWLALAWALGGLGPVGRALGDRMTRAMARWLRAPGDPAHIGSGMNYPYFIAWTGAHGSYRDVAPVAPTCPTLFLYGTRKPFMFHSRAWTEQLAQRPGSAVQAFKTGHWLMTSDPDGFNRVVLAWLGGAPGTPA